MNVCIYLPDDLGRRAKAELPRRLSRLLRDAVTAELDRIDAARRHDAVVDEGLAAIRTHQLNPL